ncbi:MAG: ferric reductase-like transmembrane domain-containing protein [Paracoccaceae bacterium]|nr:ferric reductase-like transmembrane domain-containing protein [Paracoccaceae bacterium]
MKPIWTALIWTVLITAIVVPIAAAAASPLLAWREPIYIAAGLAGVLAMGLMLFQPLLAGGYLPGLSVPKMRWIHRIVGSVLLIAVIIHVAALWITSPPDVVDALLFASPTPFSVWGVIAMWALFASALLVVFRRRLRLRTWRFAHTTLAVVIVSGTVAHALLIEGTMETVSKISLSALILAATLKTVADLRAWRILSRKKA